LRNINISAGSGSNRDLSFEISLPVAENSRSDSTDVAGTDKNCPATCAVARYVLYTRQIVYIFIAALLHFGCVDVSVYVLNRSYNPVSGSFSRRSREPIHIPTYQFCFAALFFLAFYF